MNPGEQLAAYRLHHVIRPVEIATAPAMFEWACKVDGLRVLERRSRGRRLYRHDPDAIKRLVREASRV